MKYSKRDREQAALICAIAANSRWEGSKYDDWLTTWKAGLYLDASSSAMCLADLAWFSSRLHGQMAYADAEARIRTGWEPK